MGMLIVGKWHDIWYDTKESNGRFERSKAQFRNWVTVDGSPGPTGVGGFKAEAGRYHLYVSHACPWAHRTMIFRALKGLEDAISVSVVDYIMGEEGWTFYGTSGSTGDDLFGLNRAYEIYLKADPGYTGRVTVPILWDKVLGTIVSNESADIIRMMNANFEGVAGNGLDFYPKALRHEIDEINAFIYDGVNNGVYRTGFATTQEAYGEAYKGLFLALNQLEERLSKHRYLLGDTLTEADFRLFTTLVRFDAVYVGHFKCNYKRIVDYPNLWGYTRELYQMPGVSETIHMNHIKGHYYMSHGTINPTAVVPLGPFLDFLKPHGRG
ncbi:MAG: glutathione S-transferase family protein [Turicibacter sp.]|nr:glutathione S-transferase family protein [Turicibacter sp.]